jgi:transcriptional regulator with XRE-family HTH domain
MRTFGETLRAAILAKGLTLREVAKSTGTHKGYISGICNRKVDPPSEKMILRLCRVLGLDYDATLARAVVEKMPKGLPYRAIREILTEAESTGQLLAPGKPTC